jgi:DNA-binding beta-propeller fold protein YncE
MITRILLVLFMFPFNISAQVFSEIPEAPIKLNPFYLSSRQLDVKTKLSAPSAITVAKSGNIYVFDDGNSRIVKLSPLGKFITEFGGPGSGSGVVKRANLNDSIAVDQDENIYVSDPATPQIQVFDANGAFVRSFRIPFPMTSIAVNRKREIFVAVDTTRPPQLIYVFSETGKFLRRIGERLIKARGSLARTVNQAVITFDAQDNLFVAFRSWPLVRKYSPAGKLIAEMGFEVPSELISESQRKNYSLDFFATHPDTSFVPPWITHSVSVDGSGTGYLLLNAHSIVVFSNNRVLKQFRFRAPRDRNNVFLRLAVSLNSRTVYLLDTRSGEIYKNPASLLNLKRS